MFELSQTAVNTPGSLWALMSAAASPPGAGWQALVARELHAFYGDHTSLSAASAPEGQGGWGNIPPSRR